jgi:hypothetical protein
MISLYNESDRVFQMYQVNPSGISDGLRIRREIVGLLPDCSTLEQAIIQWNDTGRNHREREVLKSGIVSLIMKEISGDPDDRSRLFLGLFRDAPLDGEDASDLLESAVACGVDQNDALAILLK